MKKILATLLVFVSLSAVAASDKPTLSIRPSSSELAPQAQAQAMTPGYCEVEVANLSSQSAIVDIYYDDAAGFRNNYVQPGYSLYVDLYYNGYCHNRSYLVISSPNNYLLYAAYAKVYDIINITNGFNKKMEAALKA
jgi:hypothetical protein